jgi:hypothetical protein
MRYRHLADELEHLVARHLKPEQVTALLARRCMSGEGMTNRAVLREQLTAAGVL